MRVALDTNILAYAEGVNGAAMRRTSLDLLSRLPQDSVLLPVQSLAELFHLLVRKAGRSPIAARRAVVSWADTFSLIETSAPVFLIAAQLSASNRVRIWDAVILSAAAEAGCRLLLSEDLQEGFTWAGVTVTNPYLHSRNALLTALLDSGPDR